MELLSTRTPIDLESPSFRQGLPESRLQGCITNDSVTYGIKSVASARGSHPWLLDSGNPCRNDGLRAGDNCDIENKQ